MNPKPLNPKTLKPKTPYSSPLRNYPKSLQTPLRFFLTPMGGESGAAALASAQGAPRPSEKTPKSVGFRFFFFEGLFRCFRVRAQIRAGKFSLLGRKGSLSTACQRTPNLHPAASFMTWWTPSLFRIGVIQCNHELPFLESVSRPIVCDTFSLHRH